MNNFLYIMDTEIWMIFTSHHNGATSEDLNIGATISAWNLALFNWLKCLHVHNKSRT